MSSCLICGNGGVRPLLDFGRQPVCCRFLTPGSEEEFTHPLAVGQCGRCALVQILDPAPAEDLTPRVSWISYNEMSAHLPALAERIRALPGISAGSSVCATSYKEDELLDLLKERGLRGLWRVDLQPEMRLAAGSGVEMVQDRLTPEMAAALGAARGAPDLVIARHILEHAGDPIRFLGALRTLVKPGGCIVLEVPDCSEMLATCDYSGLWEEHTLYFTPATFRAGLECAGLSIVDSVRYPYSHESSLVVIAVPNGSAAAPPAAEVRAEFACAQSFANGFTPRRDACRGLLERYRKERGRIAVFGAGHAACLFINIMGLGDLIEFAVEELPAKHGYRLPGSRLPIVPPEELFNREIALCLLAVRPPGDENVAQRYARFQERGGEFGSIFPSSRFRLPLPEGL